jgi:signal transduction histidine kinase
VTYNTPMKRTSPRPRLWRYFTLLCVGTTVMAVLLAQTGLTLFASAQVIDSKEAIVETEQFMGQYAVQMRPYFAGERPDEEGVRQWLNTQYTVEFKDPDLFPLSNGAYIVQIVDLKDTIIASIPDKKSIGNTVSLHPKLQLLKKEAKDGVTKAGWENKKMFVVVPILKKEEVVAYGLVQSDSFTFWGIFSRGFSRLITSTMTLTALPTLLIGGGLGMMISHWVGKRLSGISTAAEAWGRGDLTATAPETPCDEFGLLAGRLNTMARDLQQVIALRQEVAVLEERENMLRELHDTVKQQAFAASLVVSSARVSAVQGDKAGLENALGEAETITRQIQTELAGILEKGRTQGEGSLHEQLTRSIGDWSRRSEIHIPLHLPEKEPTLMAASRLHIVRIVEEAITNAVKHSKGNTITVTLGRESKDNTEDNLWKLTIEDNGKGFDATNKRLTKTGMGLKTMQERAQNLPNGTFTIAKRPSGGTKVVLQFGDEDLG